MGRYGISKLVNILTVQLLIAITYVDYVVGDIVRPGHRKVL